MSTHFMHSHAFVFERIAYAILAAALGVGLLTIIVVGFVRPLPEGIAGNAVASRITCEGPSTVAAAATQGPVAAVSR